MITEKQFLLMKELKFHPLLTQRELAVKVGLAVSSVNENLKKLRAAGFVGANGLTDYGIAKLDEYRVDNAIIMAAGMSTRFAPLSYEKPKGLMCVKGEILIERQIRQIQDAGINKIVIVVGYMKEKFLYLEEKFGVELVVNKDYYRYNNISSLYHVRNQLGNSYICSSDNYFIDNVFEEYVYESYYACVYQSGLTDEWCVQADEHGIINQVTIGGADSYVMMGQAYFSRSFSEIFRNVLTDIYGDFGITDVLWEKVYIDNLSKLKMKRRIYDSNKILEFDSIDDLIAFDENFLNEVESEALDNIVKVMKCQRNELSEFTVLKKGLTNHSVRFRIGDKRYVYRYPGEGTEKIINRHSEKFSQEQACRLGLDDTYIYMDADKGWKISIYLENNCEYDYKNDDDLNKAMQLLHRLHGAAIKSQWSYNLFDEAEKMYELIKDSAIAQGDSILPLREKIVYLYKMVEGDNVEKCLCHVDCLEANFLTNGSEMYLIDWEYSGMADPATDLGTMLCCADYDDDTINHILKVYFGRSLTLQEERHYKAYIALAAYCWFIWAVYQESVGQNIGDRLVKWYRYAVRYCRIAMELYNDK